MFGTLCELASPVTTYEWTALPRDMHGIMYAVEAFVIVAIVHKHQEVNKGSCPSVHIVYHWVSWKALADSISGLIWHFKFYGYLYNTFCKSIAF